METEQVLYVEKLEILQKQLKEVQNAFLTISKSGISQQILIAYLKDRTGMSKERIKYILEAQEDFYRLLQPVERRK